MSEVAGEIRGARFGLRAAWAASMVAAILLWVGVAALAPRAEQGHVVALDAACGTLTLETPHPAGPGLRTFTVPRNVGVQRFDERLSFGDLRPGQWVEVGVRATARAGPAVTSIRIVREAPGSVSAHAPGAASQEKTRCETTPRASGSAQG